MVVTVSDRALIVLKLSVASLAHEGISPQRTRDNSRRGYVLSLDRPCIRVLRVDSPPSTKGVGNTFEDRANQMAVSVVWRHRGLIWLRGCRRRLLIGGRRLRAGNGQRKGAKDRSGGIWRSILYLIRGLVWRCVIERHFEKPLIIERNQQKTF